MNYLLTYLRLWRLFHGVVVGAGADGGAIRLRGVVLSLKGDWKWFKECLQLTRWSAPDVLVELQTTHAAGCTNSSALTTKALCNPGRNASETRIANLAAKPQVSTLKPNGASFKHESKQAVQPSKHMRNTHTHRHTLAIPGCKASATTKVQQTADVPPMYGHERAALPLLRFE